MLELESLVVAYGPQPVLFDLSFEVHPGEVVAIVGPNGAGKTTLIRAVSGILPPHSGDVRVGGVNVSTLSPGQRARSLAVVPQARHLPVSFTVWQAVFLGRTPYLDPLGRGGSTDRAKVLWALERTRTLALADRKLEQLSGGEQQRVLLARALAQGAPILLLDEPTAHLDLEHQSNLLNLVRELAAQQDLAVLMALHDLNLVSLYADRVALLVAGRLRALGAPSEVLTSEFLSAAFNLPIQVIPHPVYGTPLIIPDGKVTDHVSAEIVH